MNFKDFIHWSDKKLFEEIISSEVQQLAQQIGSSIDHEHPMVNATIIRNITSNPSITKLNPQTGQDEGEGSFPANLLKNLASNYKFYFGKISQNFQHAEAILFEFPNYQTFIIYLGFLPNGAKLAAFAVPPYYYIKSVRKKPIASSIPQITNILRQFGFKVHAQGDQEIASNDEDLEFLNRLVGVFRFVASRYFDFSKQSWDEAKKQYYSLQQEMPQAYHSYLKKIQNMYPNGVVARRKIIVPDDFMVQTTNGDKLPISQIGNKEIYYPNHYVMSQWTENELNPKEMDTSFGSGKGQPYILKGKIPANHIVYSQRILPTGLTQLKVEGEIIVDHAPGTGSTSVPAIDTDIICSVYKENQFKWDQD